MRKATLARFTHALILEFRLMATQWIVPVLFLAWCIASWQLFNQNEMATAEYLFLSQFSFVVPAFTSLGLLILSGIGATRSSRMAFELLEKSYPVGVEIWLGRWLATVCIGLLFLLPPIAIAAMYGINADFLPSLLTFLLETLVIFTSVSAFVYFVHVTLGIQRWTFVAFVLIWLGCSVLPGILASQIPAISLISFPNTASIGFYYSEIFGRLTAGQYPKLFVITYAGVTIMLLGAIITVVQRKRRHQLALSGIGLAIVGIGMVGYGATAYSRGLQTALDEVGGGRVGPIQTDEPILTARDLPYFATDYDIMLDMRSDLPRYQVDMVLHNRGTDALETVDFVLNRALTIIDSNVGTMWADGNQIHFTLPQPLSPNETLPISLVYEGQIVSYEPIWFGRTPGLDAFTFAEGLNLPCDVGWYPIAGIRSASPNPFDVDCMLDVPTSITVSVAGVESLDLVSNLPQNSDNSFQSDNATWVHMLGSSGLVQETSGDVTLVTGHNHYEEARATVDSLYQPAMAHLSEFYPQVDDLKLLVTGRIATETTAMTDGTLFTVLQTWDLNDLDPNSQAEYRYVWIYLLDSIHGTSYSALSQNIAYFLWVQQITDGDSDAMATYIREQVPSDDGSQQIFLYSDHQQQFALANVLYDAYLEGGNPAVSEVLQTLYDNIDDISMMNATELADWLMAQ